MKNKGFTLIELLAVIIILAIIALIAVPTIVNLIEKSKMKALENAAYGFIRAGEYYYMNNPNETYPKTFIGKDYKDENDSNKGLKFKGKKVEGKVTIDPDGKIAIDIYDNGYHAYKGEDENKVTVVEGSNTEDGETAGYSIGEVVYYNPVSGQKCDDYVSSQSTGTAKTGCLKWYVIKDSGETVDVLLDHNTTYGVAWNSSGSNANGPAELLTQLRSDTSSWTGVPARKDSYTDPLKGYTIDYTGYRARLIEANEIAKITGADTALQWDSGKPYGTTIGTQSAYYYLDGAYGTDSIWQTQVAKSQGASHYAWLFDYTKDCTSYGCNKVHNSTEGYWTSSASAVASSHAWRVDRGGEVFAGYVHFYSAGARPVITIDKSLISS